METVDIKEVQKQQYEEVLQVLIRDYGFIMGSGNISKNIGGGLAGGTLNPNGNRTGFVNVRSGNIYLTDGLGKLFGGTVQGMYCGWSAETLAAEFMKKVNSIAVEK